MDSKHFKLVHTAEGPQLFPVPSPIVTHEDSMDECEDEDCFEEDPEDFQTPVDRFAAAMQDDSMVKYRQMVNKRVCSQCAQEFGEKGHVCDPANKQQRMLETLDKVRLQNVYRANGLCLAAARASCK